MSFLREIKRLFNNYDALIVLENKNTGKIIIIPGENIITDAGDIWYSQSACGQVPTNTFANLYLATAGPDPVLKTNNYSHFTVVAGSSKAKTAGYPKVPDDDGDNTGAGADVVSWKFEYTIGDGPFIDITHSFIAKAGAGGTDPILNSYKWAAAWSKDASTSAKIFANHTMNGV